MAGAGLALRILQFLQGEDGPVPSEVVARRFLKISEADEEVLVKLLSPLLSRAGALYTPGEGWRARPTYPLPGPAAPSVRPDTLSEPAPRSRQVACAVDWKEGRIRGLSVVEVGSPGESRRIDGAEWSAISRLVAGADAVFADPRTESVPFRMALASRRLAGPARSRSLAGAVRGRVRLRRGAGPEEIAASLQVPWPDEPGPGDVAECIAGCLRKVRQMKAAGGDDDPGTESTLAGILTAGFLGEVPSSPGVYSFHDGRGRTIYVGKAANLRRRLRSYLAEKRRLLLESLPEVARIEYRETGSDLRAVLEEAAMIRRHRPPMNIQKEVHGRRAARPAKHARALLLPAATRGSVTVIVLEGGRFEALETVGPRGGGLSRVEILVKRVLSRRRGSGPGGRDGEVESRLVHSWLARHGEPTQLDLESCRGPADAMRRLRRAVEEVRSGTGGEVIHFK